MLLGFPIPILLILWWSLNQQTRQIFNDCVLACWLQLKFSTHNAHLNCSSDFHIFPNIKRSLARSSFLLQLLSEAIKFFSERLLVFTAWPSSSDEGETTAVLQNACVKHHQAKQLIFTYISFLTMFLVCLMCVSVLMQFSLILYPALCNISG